MKQFNKSIALILSLVMILSMVPMTALGLDFTDMPNDWSTEALEKAVANGLLKGDNGKIRAGDNLTRAEMATIVNRSFKAFETSSLSKFKDVSKDDWFYDEMSKAVAMETFQGDGENLNPNNPITREQAFAVIARAFKLGESTIIPKGFSDLSQISSWATGEVYGLVNNGYIQGSNGKLNPKGYITRAEFAQMMDNVIKEYVNAAGDYTIDVAGNLMVNTPGVTLSNSTIAGDLVIGDGVGEGEVILDDVTVTGRVLVRGGGTDSIIIKGDSNIASITIVKINGAVRVYSEDGTEIGDVVVDGKDDVIVEGTFTDITVLSDDITVKTTNATINNVRVEGNDSKILIGESSTVKKLILKGEGTETGVSGKVEQIEVEETAEETLITVDEDGQVGNIEVNSPGTKVEGKGKVTDVQANADDVVVETEGTKVTASKGTKGVMAGDEEVDAEDSKSVGEEEKPRSSGGSSGSSRPDPAVVPVSDISVNPTTAELTVGATETLVATVEPSNATNKTVTWSSSDEGIATVEDGVVTAVAEGEAMITAKAGGKTATVGVIVKLSDDAQAAADAEAFKTTHATILGKTVETVAIDDKTSVEAALTAYSNLSEAAQAKLVDGEKTLLDNLLVKIGELEAAADLQTAKTTVEGLTYTDLVVEDMEDATKKAAVETVVNAASLPEGVTATVNADGSKVTLSKDLAEDVIVDTNATFKLSDDAKNAADDQAVKAFDALDTKYALKTDAEAAILAVATNRTLAETTITWEGMVATVTLNEGTVDLVFTRIQEVNLANTFTEFETELTDGKYSGTWDQLILTVNNYNVGAATDGIDVSAYTAVLETVTEIDMSNKNQSQYDISTGVLVPFKNLETLNLSNTGITEIGGLADLTNLKNLDVSGNTLPDLGALENLTNLETLNVSNTGSSNISVVALLTKLQTLDISENAEIKNISPLVALVNAENALTSVDLTGTGVVDNEGLAVETTENPGEVQAWLDTLVDKEITVTGYDQTAQNLANAKANLDLGDISAIVADMTLPTAQDDATVTWASDTTAVIAADGTVTRPAFGAGDTTVKLTATLTVGEQSDTKAFTVTVLAETVDPSKVVATNKEELQAALTNETVTEITIDGVLGSEDRDTGYIVYEVKRAVTIQGADNNAKVYGTFVIESPDVTIKDLAIQNRGDAESLNEGNTTHRSGFKVEARNVTLTNNRLTNGLGELDGLSNAIQIRTKEESQLSSYVIENNEFIGHEHSWGTDWTSTGILIYERYSDYKQITATAQNYQDIMTNNTFTNNAIDLAHMDYAKTNGTLYLFRLPFGYVTSLGSKIAEADALTETDYTAETWTTLQTALTTAKEVEGNIAGKQAAQEGTYQAVIINANEALEAALDKLEYYGEKVTTESVQNAIDNAAEGTTIVLSPGNYGTLYLRQSELSQSVDVTDWAGDSDVERYREIKNLRIIGTKGAKVDGIRLETGQLPPANHSNEGHVNSYISISNLTLENIDFTGENHVAVNLRSTFGSSNIDGLLIDGCTLTGKSSSEGEPGGNLLRADGSTSEVIKDKQENIVLTTGRKNLTIKNNIVSDTYIPVNITEWDNITFEDNKFSNSGRNHILVTGPSEETLNITGNILDKCPDRAIRLNAIKGTVNITGNTIKECDGRDNLELMKLDFVGDNRIINISENSWNTKNDKTAIEDGHLVINGASAIKIEGLYSATPDNIVNTFKTAPEGSIIQLTAGEHDLSQLTYIEPANNLTLIGSEDVTVKGIRLGGANQYAATMPDNLTLKNIALTGSFDIHNNDVNNLTIDSCTFSNQAVLKINSVGTLDGLTIKNSTFNATGQDDKTSILVQAPASNVLIENNTITGSAHNGIQITRVNGSLTINGNTISNTGSRSMRIATLEGANITITDNIMSTANTNETEAAENNGEIIKISGIVTDGTFTNNTYGSKDIIFTNGLGKIQYALSSTGDNITLEPAAGNIDEGTTVTVTVAPAEGQQVATFTVGGEDKKSELLAETVNKYTFTMTADTEVVVIYEAISEPTKYTVTYDVNGGTGTAPTQEALVKGGTFTVADTTGLTAPSEKQFKEWNTSADGTGTTYAVGSTFTVSTENVILYAIWEATEAPTYEISTTTVGGTATIEIGLQESSAGQITSAKEGTTIIVDITGIGDGKHFKSIEVKATDNSTIDTQENTPGEAYSFTMPAQAVTVTVTLTKNATQGTITGEHVIGTSASKTYIATIKDAESTPVVGVTVDFGVISTGDTQLTNITSGGTQTVTTDTYGQARYTLTTNNATEGDQYTVSATISEGDENVATGWNGTVTTIVDTGTPTLTFDPLNEATGIAINKSITITFNEAVRKLDNNELSNDDLAGMLTFKKTDVNGENVAFTASVDANKKVITITPTTNLTKGQAYYLAIAAKLEDEADNAITATNITFTTVAQ